MIRLATIALLVGGCELLADIPGGKLAGDDDPAGDCTTGELLCEAPTPVCHVETATCVECLANTDCPGQRPFCDVPTTTCTAGCTADAQCETGSCLADGTCAETARIRYAAVGGAGDCSQASPCSIETAVAQLAAGIDVIQLAAGTYELAATLVPPSDAIFNGTDVTLRLATGNSIIEHSGISVAIHRITLDAPAGIGVFCSGSGKIALSRVRADGAVAAIIASVCEARVDRSRFSGNTFYAMLVNTGPVVMTNTFITNNGSASSNFGGLILDNLVAGSVIEHNTIAGNTNDGMGPSGITRCLGAPAMFTATIRNNIVRGNTIDPACTISSSVIDPGFTGPGTNNSELDPGFVNALGGDHHLMPGSPVAGMSDPSSPTVFFDHDGEPRPQPAGSNPDPGADEIP